MHPDTKLRSEFLQALDQVLEYLWDSEAHDFLEAGLEPKGRHIFQALRTLRDGRDRLASLLENKAEPEKGAQSAVSPQSFANERILRVGDKIIWKPGGILPPSIEEVTDIRANVDMFTGEGQSIREISWERLRTEGPQTAIFLKDEMPTHGWLVDPVDPWPLDKVTPYEPGEPVLFQGDSPFLPNGTRGLVESVSQSGIEVLFENGYRFTLTPKLLVPAPEYSPTQEPNL